MTLSDWIAGGSLVVSLFALWRTVVAPTQALRTSVLRDAAELRVDLDALAKQIPFCVQSRDRVSSAIGRGGALDIFKAEAAADLAETGALELRIGEIEGITSWTSSYADMEDKAKAMTSVRARAKQLADKYAAGFAQDESTRAHLRDSATQRALLARS
jgi:hypothetical protein